MVPQPVSSVLLEGEEEADNFILPTSSSKKRKRLNDGSLNHDTPSSFDSAMSQSSPSNEPHETQSSNGIVKSRSRRFQRGERGKVKSSSFINNRGIYTESLSNNSQLTQIRNKREE